MAYKTLIFGVDDLFAQLQPFYNQAVQRGILDIVAYAVIEPKGIRLVTPDGKRGGADNLRDVQLAIISSKNDFYRRMKILEANGFPRNRIIDGSVFQVPNLDFPRLIAEGVVYGVLETNSLVWENFFSRKLSASLQNKKYQFNYFDGSKKLYKQCTNRRIRLYSFQ